MADTTRRINASRERVWAELSDAWMFSGWVVGATHIRGVDEHWPQPGARLHHQIGAWPFVRNGDTMAVENEPPHRLVLQAKAWPAGEARIEFTLEPDGEGTLIRMVEYPTHGAARTLFNPLLDAALNRRNAESLARLASIAENRPLQVHPTGS
jgi:uncharacterized protein YndB with AHSA1/START domain